MNTKILGRSIIVKKGDGSQVKESTDSSTTLEDDDIKGRKSIFLCIFDYCNHHLSMCVEHSKPLSLFVTNEKKM